jgi:hypothetical protein
MTPLIGMFGGGSNKNFGFGRRIAAAALYEFASHVFTNAGVTGRTGPTLAQCRTAYSSASWTQNNSFFNMTTQGIQLWTVPQTGDYIINCLGAQGGQSRSREGGRGARIQGTVNLTQGDILKIAVGQAGQGDTNGAGAGGGSFVTTSNNTPIMIAGGGGGSGGYGDGLGANQFGGPGQTGTSGQSDIPNTFSTYYRERGIGGTNGSGGGTGSNHRPGGGGGGLLSDGGIYTGSWGGGGWGNPGKAFITTAEGGAGESSPIQDGGFGGGGGGWGGGGGGGYSGGGAGGWSDATASNNGGGGGGSFNSGTNQTNQSGQNTSHGSITITKL